MLLIARCQLTGVYGTVGPGQQFDCPDDIAGELLRAGVVRKAEPPKILYEMKVIPVAPEVGPVRPFPESHMPVPDAQPEAVAAAGDPVVPIPDVSEQRAADPGGRRRRPRLAFKR